MSPPLDSYGSYGPHPEGDPSLPPQSGGRFPWFQWLPMIISSALLVLFVNQLIELQNINRRVARLYERMDNLDRVRMLDTGPALAAQQTLIIRRLQELEAIIGTPGMNQEGSSGSDQGPAAMQPTPPPPAP